MQQLQPPDTHHLSAATGWLGLGNLCEAEADLNRISAEMQCHPDVLEVRWELLAGTGRWEAAVSTARTLLKMAPNRASGWLHQAYALRRATHNGLRLAWDALLPAAEKFPQEPTIPYNLSCYACQMHLLDEARFWLRRALKTGHKDQLKEMAAADPDLRPLWDELGDW